MEVTKPKVVIAGAGGGKTHQMINEIIEIIPHLKNNPEKFCAVVTYTNAATEEIKKRVSKKINIPHNLHISTTHSFLTKFIIDPYAYLFNLLPLDKNYIDKVNLTYKSKNFFAEKASCIKKANELSSQKGIIIYDKILETSFELISQETICNQVSTRLAYIFVDEYQDMRLYQHKIFNEIILKGKTNFYCIGDPLQSIYNFSYTQSQLSKEPKPNGFLASPILEFNRNKHFETNTITINNRCSKSIINLINNFNNKIGYQQELPEEKKCNQIPVYFIIGDTKPEIVEKYSQIMVNHNIQKENGKMFSLIIAKDWDTFNDISNVNKINFDNGTTKTMFHECSRIILSTLGINKTTFLKIIPYKDKREKHLKYREFCFSILKDIRIHNFEVDRAYIINEFKQKFKINLPDDTNKNINTSKALEGLKIVTKYSDSDRFCSSIHNSKGLEATNVLVISKTNKQLLKWLDFKNVVHDTDDDYRLGYVAFSRAREILCITSLEKPDKTVIDKLKSLNIQIV
ncbi:UvrD-helicase domain-containing protein [Flavobacterium sp. GCM10027622]|uniref:UvrD-helicase domain-containing protein n=1 Tax=unclassified Flavobacterium TaxID=196869 RepID=UPI0036210AF1